VTALNCYIPRAVHTFRYGLRQAELAQAR